jgi:hypothetical protein
MIPNTKITVFPGGNSKVEGLEKSENCYKLNEMGKAAGKVESEKKKDHTPVYQDVNVKGGN